MEAKAQSSAWEGRVAVSVELAASDVTALSPPPPLFLLLPRCGYLPLAFEAVRRHYLASAPDRVDDLWFEADGVPLRWAVPVGVLFDLFCRSRDLPWRLVVHMQAFPADRLPRCSSLETLRVAFVNELKQALFVRYESAKYAMNLHKSDHAALWAAVAASDGAGHAAVVAKALREGGAPELPAAYGVRVLSAGFDGSDPGDWHRTVQVRFAPATDEARTVGDLVTRRLGVAAPCEAVCQGVVLPPDTPLEWAARNLSHADLFLYLVLRPRPAA